MPLEEQKLSTLPPILSWFDFANLNFLQSVL